jgi:hypothetical protein
MHSHLSNITGTYSHLQKFCALCPPAWGSIELMARTHEYYFMRNITVFLLLSTLLGATAEAQLPAGTNLVWPQAIPCRTQDGTNRDLFVMTLGPVSTPIADGIFHPLQDEVTLNNGLVISNYYRDTLGVKFYQPLDKSHFPAPPSGWCTWYYYYNRINETEVKNNARWLADHLKDYGAKYVQIDDGWQGAGGTAGQRDWTTVNRQRFPAGMADLAAYIKSLGLEPGLWLAPHGQSNPEVVRAQTNVFLLKPDGSSASDTWEGKFLLDPSTPESALYLKDLFSKLAGWGYDYFKIDGQPIVVDEYNAKKSYLKNPSSDADADALYRQTLKSIRTAIGPDRYLLGCWGTPLAGAGIMNGSRTGGDVVLGWGGFHVALRPTLEYYFLHNIVWYSDPDVLLVRSPLSLDQARVWATVEGLTGQALMSSDRLPDLSPERVELLRRVYPATDIRPLDLFPSEQNKRIWDLKINHLNRRYDVVGVFNFTSDQAESTGLDWRELGLSDEHPIHVFDFWNQEYLGDWAKGIVVEAAPTSCRVLTLLPDNGRIQLISTSRHITQGWVDLLALNENKSGDTFTGTSQVVNNDPYELRFVFPRGTNYLVDRAVASAGWRQLPAKIFNHQGWAAVRITPSKTGELKWQVRFAPAQDFHFPPSAPESAWVERIGLDGVMLHWQEQYYLNAGYQVYLDGELLGYTPTASFPIRHLTPAGDHSVAIKSVAADGRESARSAEIKFCLAALAPAQLSLTQLEPVRFTGGWRGYEIGDQLARTSLTLGAVRHEAALSTFAGSEIEFDLKGLYQKFTALTGVDASSEEHTVVDFIVLGDGRELWRSGPLKKTDAPQVVAVKVTGVHQLTLRTTGTSNDEDHSQAGWAEPVVSQISP